MKRQFFLSAFCAATSAFTVFAQETQIRLFPNGAPGETQPLTEQVNDPGYLVGNEPLQCLTNVSDPTITLFPALEENNSGSAVIVCPGGGYDVLAYDLEGTEICNWLNDLGITAILLKYRVPRREGLQKHEAPLQDAQRAVSYVRAHAEEWGIVADRIGIMGFSAGGHLSAMVSTSFATRTYAPLDEADRVSCRPDFCLLVYPAYLSGEEGFRLAPEVKVSSEVPPTMMIQAEDDADYIDSSLFYYYALKQAKVPAWLHLYSKGGHGYGLRNTGSAVNEWTQRAEDWFEEIGVIPADNEYPTGGE